MQHQRRFGAKVDGAGSGPRGEATQPEPREQSFGSRIEPRRHGRRAEPISPFAGAWARDGAHPPCRTHQQGAATARRTCVSDRAKQTGPFRQHGTPPPSSSAPSPLCFNLASLITHVPRIGLGVLGLVETLRTRRRRSGLQDCMENESLKPQNTPTTRAAVPLKTPRPSSQHKTARPDGSRRRRNGRQGSWTSRHTNSR